MIYTNVKFRTTSKKVHSHGQQYTMTGIMLGMNGKKCRSILLPMPKERRMLKCYNNSNLTIALSKSKKPKIIMANASYSDAYVILSSRGSDSGQGRGYITALKNQKVEIVGRASGRDGNTKNLWQELILKVEPGDMFKVVWSGSQERKISCYAFWGDVVIEIGLLEAENLCEKLDIPAEWVEI